MSWQIGVDVGGTFTDFYARNAASGEVRLFKRPSTPANPAEAIVAGLGELAAAEDIDAADVERLCHGTTVATNALIQRRGGRVALLTTRGFRDLLEIGRQTRPHMFDLQLDHPPALVPRERRIEVAERVTAEGRVVADLDEAAVKDAVAAIAAMAPEAVAVCFLFSFLNPAHERQLARALRAALPELRLSLSSEVQPEFREYERFSTTVLNAYLQPVIERYLTRLEAEVAGVLPRADVGIYQSSGGLMSIDVARRFPVRTALSGPAAGAVGAVHEAGRAGRGDVITLDMGGTSADVCLIRNFEAGIGFEREVAGFPVRLPMVDINTVGAGGGSLAWFDRDGLMKVGPDSAGADPGPACYGRGGSEPTVTDANLVLGRLSPQGLIGGRMPLDEPAARAALLPAAKRLGLRLEKTALGVVGIVVANMVRAIRAISVERGLDPRRYALMPFGGAGPLHAGDVARALGMRTILVPPAPGILCAQGLIVSDLKENFVRSGRLRLDDGARAALAAEIAALAEQAAAWFTRERVAPAAQSLLLTFDMRYVGQNFELAVPLERARGGAVPALPRIEALREQFFAVHEQQYGFHNRADAVEVINVRLTANGAAPAFEAVRAGGGAARASAPVAHRTVFFADDGGVETPIYRRGDLGPGDGFTGPAVVEQLDATTLLHPGDRLTVDAAGTLVIEVTP